MKTNRRNFLRTATITGGVLQIERIATSRMRGIDKNYYTMKKELILSLLSLVLLVSVHHISAQSFEDYDWQNLECTGEPIARHEAAFIEVAGKFYLMGGRRVQEVSIFDPETNTWASGQKPPIEIHHFQGFGYQGKVYAVGAFTDKYPHEIPIPHAYIYDPESDSWSKGFDMPTGRERGAATANVYKNKLYVAGGILDGHWDGHVRWFDSYDFETGTWERLPDAPRARDHASAVICNDKLYLIGGRATSRFIGKVLELTVPEVDVFDFKAGKWSTLEAKVPTPRAGCTAISIGDKILFTGGETANQVAAHNEVEVLDTKTGTWSTLPSMIQGRHGTQLIWYKNKLYIASGCSERGGSTELTSIDVFSN